MPQPGRDSDAHDAMHLLGYMLLMHGRAEDALAVLRALALLAPGNHRASLLFAHAAQRCGQSDLALQVLDRLLDAGEDAPVLHLLRGQALAAQGDGAEASRSLERFTQRRAADLIARTEMPA